MAAQEHPVCPGTSNVEWGRRGSVGVGGRGGGGEAEDSPVILQPVIPGFRLK